MADDDARARRTAKAGAGKKAAGATRGVAKKATPAARAAPVRKTATKKQPATKAAPVKRAVAARKAVPVKKAVKKTGGAVLGRAPAAGPSRPLGSGRSYAGDWEEPPPPPPEPAPVREDPQARIRGILRAAARSIEEREHGSASTPPPAPAPQAPSPEPPARVLVAPVTPEPDLEEEEEELYEVEELDEAEVDEELEEEEEEWMPPDVIEAAAPPPPPPPPPPPSQAPTQVVTEPPPPVTPPAAEERPARGGGSGLSVLAILLALVLPLVGALIGLVISGRARARGARLSGVARGVSIVALIAWFVGAGLVGYAISRDDGVDYSKLKVGDCFDSESSNEVRGVKVKPCSEPHNSEIFFLVDHPAGPEEPYPGKDTLVQFAADTCLGQPLTDYLGIPLEQSRLKDFEIVPQAAAWEEGRRVLVCGLDTGGEGRITGSVKGTRR